MNTVSWLRKSGFMDIKSRTFASDIIGPIGPEVRAAFHGFADMLWYSAKEELSTALMNKYREITDPESEAYIFNKLDYTGFTYDFHIIRKFHSSL